MDGKGKITPGQRIPEIVFTTASRLIFSGRCIVYSVILGADGANADCQVFDDPGGNSNEKLHLEALSGTTSEAQFPRGVVFNNGIYITVNASTSHVSISFIPFERGLYYED